MNDTQQTDCAERADPAGEQGRSLLAWPDAGPDEGVDASLLWRETMDGDAAVLADIIRQMSWQEALIDYDGLFRAFQDCLRDMAKAKALAEKNRAAGISGDGEEEAGAESPEPEASPPPRSRRDVLNALLRLRHEKLAEGGAPREYPGEAGDQETYERIKGAARAPEAAPEGSEGDGDKAAGEIPVREISPEYFAALLSVTLAGNDDLGVLRGLDGGEYYHCRQLLSASYGRILTGRNSPALLMADVIRSHSRDYPRPCALDIFELPPFNFSPDVIQQCLRELADSPETQDIDFVTSSVGTVYFYSSSYLDKDYAAFLAENADLGMVTSP
jgi:hypothetical protein